MSEQKQPNFAFKNGQEVRDQRRRLGLNQSDFWSHVCVTQSGGSRYESGREMPETVMIALHIAYGTEKQAKDMFDSLRNNEKAKKVVRASEKKAA